MRNTAHDLNWNREIEKSNIVQYSGTRGAWGPTEQEPVDDKPLNIVVMFPSISIVHNIGNRAVRNLGAGGQLPLHS